MPSEIAHKLQRRRSQRLLLRTRIDVRGASADGAPFEEHTETLVVNAHGALILLSAPVTVGAPLVVRNRTTHQEVDARVAHIEKKTLGKRNEDENGAKTQVGIEFAVPAPAFWCVRFPPEDWSPPEGDGRAAPAK